MAGAADCYDRWWKQSGHIESSIAWSKEVALDISIDGVLTG